MTEQECQAKRAEIRAEAARRVPQWTPDMTEEVGFGAAGRYCWSHERWETMDGGCGGRKR